VVKVFSNIYALTFIPPRLNAGSVHVYALLQHQQWAPFVDCPDICHCQLNAFLHGVEPAEYGELALGGSAEVCRNLL